MKKTLKNSIVLAAITGLLLTGCTFEPAPVKPTPTATTNIPTESIISKESVLIGEVTFNSGIEMSIYQEAEGYPSTSQMEIFKNFIAPTKSVSSTKQPSLVPNQRVVVLRYELNNPTSEPVDVRTINLTAGYFAEEPSISPITAVNDKQNSIHSSLGLPTYPESFEPTEEKWELQPGASATWALDWLIPSTLNSKAELTLTQNLFLNGEWVSGLEFPITITPTTQDKQE